MEKRKECVVPPPEKLNCLNLELPVLALLGAVVYYAPCLSSKKVVFSTGFLVGVFCAVPHSVSHNVVKKGEFKKLFKRKNCFARE